MSGLMCQVIRVQCGLNRHNTAQTQTDVSISLVSYAYVLWVLIRKHKYVSESYIYIYLYIRKYRLYGIHMFPEPPESSTQTLTYMVKGLPGPHKYVK